MCPVPHGSARVPQPCSSMLFLLFPPNSHHVFQIRQNRIPLHLGVAAKKSLKQTNKKKPATNNPHCTALFWICLICMIRPHTFSLLCAMQIFEAIECHLCGRINFKWLLSEVTLLIILPSGDLQKMEAKNKLPLGFEHGELVTIFIT